MADTIGKEVHVRGPLGSLAGALRSRAARRVILVGEAPARGSVAALDEGSRTGIRVRALVAGMAPSVPFDAVNLLGCPAREWCPGLARLRARQLYDEAFCGREVVLLGRRVARAFRGLSPHLDALVGSPPFSLAAPTVPRPGGGWGRAMVWSAPHPSGRSRWWDAAPNRRAGELFFGLVLGRTEFPGPPEIPLAGDLARSAIEVLASELGVG